jgi:Heterokaryon incompatibility protein (HET)
VNICVRLEKVGVETPKPQDLKLRKNFLTDVVQGTTRDALAMEFAVSQMENCHRIHELFQQALPKPVALPARLLDLSRYTEKHRLYVVESGQLSAETVRYTALSHCWGGLQLVSLTTRNYKRLQRNGEPAKHLPKTFRDAVEASLALDISYLWIDSLCIIQNSQKE